MSLHAHKEARGELNSGALGAKGATKPLGQRLIEGGHLTEGQLDLALREQKRSGGLLGDVLVHLGFVGVEVITQFLAEESDVEVYDVRNLTISEALMDLVGYETARAHKVVPVALSNDRLTVAFADSFDVVAIDAVERECGMPVEVVTAPEGHIVETIERNYTLERSINDTIEEILRGEQIRPEDVGEQTPMVRLVDQIIGDGIKNEATDIHFHPEEKNLMVRIRVDGILRREIVVPKSIQAAVTARVKLIAGLDITERRAPQDGRIRFSFGSARVDLRVSTLPTNHGESIVLRVLDSGAVRHSLDDLGFRDADRRRFESAVDRSFGMVLVTGPTGSGKTTTLYTALGTIDRETRSVFTLEDPIEYSLPNIRQTQVNPDVGMDFSAGLRALLRQDPDVILVGEIRDQETAELATRAALTGHMVFSTLHTNSAVGVVPRLIDMGVDRYLLPSALVGIVGQRLLRRLCEHCKEECSELDPIFDEYPHILEQTGATATWMGRGCEHCTHSGYKGRIAAYEVLLIDESFHDAILEGGVEGRLKQLAAQTGMTTMLEDGLYKACAGTTSVPEVLRVLR